MKNQCAFNDGFISLARYGDLEEIASQLAAGVDIFAQDDTGWNAFYEAVDYGRFQAAELLLKSGWGDEPKAVGEALFFASSVEMVRLLAKYNPDCMVTNKKGWVAYDVMLLNKKYDLIDEYIRCGLAKPPLNQKLLKDIYRKCDLGQYLALIGITIPATLYKKYEDDIQYYFYHKKTQQKTFRKITKELSKNA